MNSNTASRQIDDAPDAVIIWLEELSGHFDASMVRITDDYGLDDASIDEFRVSAERGKAACKALTDAIKEYPHDKTADDFAKIAKQLVDDVLVFAELGFDYSVRNAAPYAIYAALGIVYFQYA